MAIRFSCEKCDRFIKAVDEKIGKKVICSSCGHSNKVPQSDKIAMDALGVRKRETYGKPGEDVEAATETLMQDVVQTYRTRDIGSDHSGGYRFNLVSVFRPFLLPLVLILLFILALVLAYTYGSSMTDN
ncbi:hypothetical protein Pla110_31010 [Polystyrenella longa]|uniref:Uncharacterized protein n=1 Tax=Polystyrenella longa TaxID=2528007 RepID=A0A518CQ58_9PLAN|nr:hypothetical protein [Polystyrenella longa]QDU81360.1 hypothetical protein Pla110_31010 [Polystyrenella longa]